MSYEVRVTEVLPNPDATRGDIRRTKVELYVDELDLRSFLIHMTEQVRIGNKVPRVEISNSDAFKQELIRREVY